MIDGIGFGLPPDEAGQVAGATASHSPEAAADKETAPTREEQFLQGLAARHPQASFLVGGGFETAHTRELVGMGKANIMFDPKMLQRLTQLPEEAEKYEDAIDRLLASFEELFTAAGGIGKDLVAWGTFINSGGLFNTWGVTDPFTNTVPLFEFFDENLMRELFKFEEKEFSTLLRDEMDYVRYEQGLEQAEEEFDRYQDLNPHIVDKPAVDTAEKLREEFSVGIDTEGAHHLDIKE